MNRSPIAEKIRVRINMPSFRAPRPRVSHQPWEGFTRHDCPRDNPLPSCPSLHCRRAKACFAAHDNLYCRRTHFSPAEQKKWNSRDPRQRELDAVPEAEEPYPLSKRLKRLVEFATIQLEHSMEMTERWKAGEFDQLYGPYRPKGVLLKPPPKIYVERSERDGA